MIEGSYLNYLITGSKTQFSGKKTKILHLTNKNNPSNLQRIGDKYWWGPLIRMLLRNGCEQWTEISPPHTGKWERCRFWGCKLKVKVGTLSLFLFCHMGDLEPVEKAGL